MRRLFWGILIGVIVVSLCFVAGAIYLIVRIDVENGIEDQARLVHEHVRARFAEFANGLAEEERQIEARMRAALPPIGMLAHHARSTNREVPPDELRNWARVYGLDDVRIIVPSGLREGMEPGWLAGRGADTVERLRNLVGSGTTLIEAMGMSVISGRLEGLGYHSPRGSDLVVRGTLDVHDFGHADRSPAYRDYLFGTFFTETARTHKFLSGVDLFVVHEGGNYSFIRNGSRIPQPLVDRLERAPTVRVSEGDRIAILSRIETSGSGLKGARFAVARTDFDYSTANALWRRLSIVIPIVLAIAAAAAFLVSRRFFDRLLVRRVDTILTALHAITGGDYGRPLALAGNDELAEIGRTIDGMRVRIQDRERELAEARDTLEIRVAERTRDLEKEIETRKAYEQRLQEMATRDALTSLWNRRAFDESAREEIGRAARYGRPLALMMLDVDHFKRVNDTHGHAAGDEVLQAVSAVLNSHGRTHDMVARVGGEEFAIIMPETELANALRVAERVRAAVEDQHILTKAGDIRVTLSAGVCAWSSDLATATAFLAAADAALYQAKKDGRNRVCVAA